ncbi:MerR family transcriptional regulator [Nocardia sp. NBC_01327]|uniref:MerR family transcriptional regulator n=1 Tax=Nocardia sp. NBC_01327 TaxID=2903593 RepID=UPI002E127D56|nr:MerR family transcriptional regulator [Nocardia sp. NBC_01327]
MFEQSAQRSLGTDREALGWFTIDRAAAFAGVTVATVRQYHQHGLIAEPESDSSGCRRYRSAELLRLAQVRALAGAGIPLAEIGDLLDYLRHIECLLENVS